MPSRLAARRPGRGGSRESLSQPGHPDPRRAGDILDVILTDGTSFAHAKWFHGGYLQHARASAPDAKIVLFGRVDFDRHESKFVFFNPEFELLDGRRQ